MKVKELISKLKECEQEAEILCAQDEEGNDYRPLDVIDDSWLYRRDKIKGVYDDLLTPDDIEHMGYTSKEIEDYKPVVIMWPG